MNTPLSSNALAKILIFTLLLLPIMAFWGFGFIPAIFLIFGIFMMKRTQEFSHLETAIRNFKIYMQVAIAIGTLLAIGSAIKRPPDLETAGALAFISLVPLTYIILINALFLNPITKHSDWVKEHGFFPKMIETKSKNKDMDIIKGEKLRSYSVADELTKWAKLKVDGHISEAEYEEARRKLLKN